ncbi:ATP-dependent helicase HrpA [Nakamurella panacisegetis]|uniref:ATP-dependent helicase HrpA n=1 Tax=Nakamurella panacisegetis TaxID=1090615 RepID=A0A1H0MK36_9ACTN|nr:ATP-dependent RNA helicase HrpA [Nakamurella panacisegetis]SDO80813.1 ATP-dependent helicase HrpA [Nakamurella panacisegetis]
MTLELNEGGTTTSAAPTVGALIARLDNVMTADAGRLGRRLGGLRRRSGQGRRGERNDEGSSQALTDLDRQIRAAEQKLARRVAGVPDVTFPPELPVSERVDDLAAAIRDHQVVIVAGETGSGKSTQLPKICLSIGRGVRGLIGHTQPRRIAARALAERIAEETGTELGDAIGYTIRFGDHTGPDTLVKLMTDGILLAEITRDRLLSAYDTIIIDEAHERSLNIDFLLGYLVELLPKRPDLKVIITSATIDPGRFSRHFGDAPIVEVSGRTYPVEIRYRPYGADDLSDDELDSQDTDRVPRQDAPKPKGGKVSRDDSSRDLAQAIVDAVDELAREGDGDVLVFLSGEREITDTAEALRGHLASRPGHTEVLPLYGRLSAADQHKVFSSHVGRRIVLSTNVAETSLTVPGIRYVVDPGTARISRYSTRTKVQRLPIEPISQASAGQRAGRCGRVADGICIRLYSEEDFAGRPEYTDPEISRTSLASVILQMASLELGDIASFPFLEPPDTRQITDGITVLTELGALDRSGDDGRVRLTPTGRALAALPLDPRLARMIVEADRLGCLADVLVITSALAIQDVREYPLEDRDRATAAHSRFADPKSDFLSLVNLWNYLADEAKARSGNAFRRMCRSEYLHYLRIREWQDLHAQLRQVARQLKMDTESRAMVAAAQVTADAGKPPPAAATRSASGRSSAAGGKRRGRRPVERDNRVVEAQPVGVAAAVITTQGKGSHVSFVDTERVHTALLSGLLSHIGLRLEPGREYQGTRGSKFVIWPGSALAKSGPRLVVAAELVETSRLWGRIVAAVDPTWVEKVGGDLLRRSYSEPRWDARRGQVTATEKVTLLGVTLIGARSIQFDRIDPVTSREMFIRHALVEADWQTRHAFFAANLAALREVAEHEDRARRRDIVIDDESLFALYDERIPADVTSSRHFDSWWRKASREHPDLLTFTPDMLRNAGSRDVDLTAYPDTFTAGNVDLGLDYVFEPGRTDDGVTVTIPLAVLARIDPAAFDAQIPGLRKDYAVALIRSLPKTLRRNFVPAPDFAAAALSQIPDDGPSGLAPALAATLTAMTGVVVRADDFEPEKIPDHLRLGFRVVDDSGRAVGEGKNLSQLQESLRADGRKAVAKASGTVERTGLTGFPPDGIPRTTTTWVSGHEVQGFPALVDEGQKVGVTVFASEADQQRAMRAGIRRLLVLGAKNPLTHVRNALSRPQMLTLTVTPHGSVAALLSDATEAAVDALLDWAGGPAWTAAEYAALVKKLTPQLDRAVLDIVVAAEAALKEAHEAERLIDGIAGTALAPQVADLRRQLKRLVHPGFLTRTTAAHLPDLTRYLQALSVRADRLRENPDRDRQRMAEINALEAEIDDAVAALRPERAHDPDVADVRRLLDEYRVASFAQPMRTAVPVSEKRLRNAIATLRR